MDFSFKKIDFMLLAVNKFTKISSSATQSESDSVLKSNRNDLILLNLLIKKIEQNRRVMPLASCHFTEAIRSSICAYSLKHLLTPGLIYRLRS